MDSQTDSTDKRACDVPVLFLLFNRPDHARRVLERLKYIKPTRLFISIDGPRPNVASDIVGVQRCIDLITEINWPCTVEKLIRKQNLGCKQAVSQAITWFFDQVEAGIILEDDCLPDPTFFNYCHILLDKYVNQPKIMHIGGCNLYNGLKWGSDSYFYTNIPHIWGWATWRRAWLNYDVNMREYPNFKRSGGIKKSVSNIKSRIYWEKSFKDVYNGRLDTWDYQWLFAIWRCEAFCITPNQNLISNIGFDEDATHTVTDSEFANLPTIPIDVRSMKFPKTIELNKEAVEYAFAHFYQLPSWWIRKFNTLRRLVTTKTF